MYEKAGRVELAEREKAELAVLAAYLPEQLPEEKIRELAKKRWSNQEPKEKRRLGKSWPFLCPKSKANPTAPGE